MQLTRSRSGRREGGSSALRSRQAGPLTSGWQGGMHVPVFAFTPSTSSSGAGRKPAAPTRFGLARGSFLGLLLLLVAVPPPAIADDVMLGRKGGSP